MAVTPVYRDGVDKEAGVLAGGYTRWEASPGDDDLPA